MSEEEEYLIIIKKKAQAAAAWTGRKVRGLWRSSTAWFHGVLGTLGLGAILDPGGAVWLLGIVNQHIGTLLPAFDVKTAAWVGFGVAVITLILRGRTAGKGGGQ